MMFGPRTEHISVYLTMPTNIARFNGSSDSLKVRKATLWLTVLAQSAILSQLTIDHGPIRAISVDCRKISSFCLHQTPGGE